MVVQLILPRRADSAAGTRKKVTTSVGDKDNLTWAPNSQKLAFGMDNKIVEVDAVGGPTRDLAKNPAGGFTVGMSARHPQYGVGKVVKISGVARNRLITVQFDDDGRTQTFVADKNPLQPVGAG